MPSATPAATVNTVALRSDICDELRSMSAPMAAMDRGSGPIESAMKSYMYRGGRTVLGLDDLEDLCRNLNTYKRLDQLRAR